jgi:hypothetical protein
MSNILTCRAGTADSSGAPELNPGKLIVWFCQDNFSRKYQKVIRNRKLKKDRQNNGQQNDKDLQSSTQKTEDRATRT